LVTGLDAFRLGHVIQDRQSRGREKPRFDELPGDDDEAL